MITLYVKPGCPYCNNVLRTIEDRAIPHELKNIYEPGVEEELIARGGKFQTPYMADSATGTELYESDDIIQYLHEHFPKR